MWAPADSGLARLVARMLGRPAARVRFRPYAYRTSHPLLELDVQLGGGGPLHLLLKDMSSPHGAQPPLVRSPTREIETYRKILAPAGIGPRFHGADRSRLLIEKIDGVELWQLEHSSWTRVATWLASAHAALASRVNETHLLRLDAAFYAAWPGRARLPRDLQRAYETASARLLALPLTLIHNELYPSNVLVGAERVAPVDWELAAAGPAVVDLAALTTGWSGEDAAAIVAAYGDVEPADLMAARLHLAVRWLGWSPGWTPPAQHRHDWLAEAEAAARELG